MWVNPNDGGHGLNARAGTNDPNDDSGHGTMVAGILGAVGNNGKGVAGVAWRVQIMACKCFNNFGQGNLSAVITCLDYARTNDARIINASWGFAPGSLALSNTVSSLRDAGIIVVAACGNSTANVDVNPVYPACYSTYGATDNYYLTQSGSSFAAPCVAGALALMFVKFPSETHQQLITRILNAVDPLPSLAGKCVTGGRLNLRNALSPPIRLTPVPGPSGVPFHLRVSGGPNRNCIIQVSTNLLSLAPIFTNTMAASGTFDFTDDQSTNSLKRFYRAIGPL